MIISHGRNIYILIIFNSYWQVYVLGERLLRFIAFLSAVYWFFTSSQHIYPCPECTPNLTYLFTYSSRRYPSVFPISEKHIEHKKFGKAGMYSDSVSESGWVEMYVRKQCFYTLLNLLYTSKLSRIQVSWKICPHSRTHTFRAKSSRQI